MKVRLLCLRDYASRHSHTGRLDVTNETVASFAQACERTSDLYAMETQKP